MTTAALASVPSAVPSVTREDRGAVGFDATGAVRADNDNAMLKTALSIDTGTASFEHCTVLAKRGGENARRHRRDFRLLPVVEEGTESLIAAVHAERRRDHTVKLG